MKRTAIFLFASLFVTSFSATVSLAQQNKNFTDSLNSKQLLVVVTDDWGSLHGTLYTYEKQKGNWVLQFSNPIVVGSKGLGIGDGLVPLSIDGAPIKKEGDMKAPAGIFTLGTAFGYGDYKDAKWIKARYIKADDTLICVDDSHSANYNTLIKNDSANGDYKSFEHMHLNAIYYKWGMFVNHNADKPKPGDGSCIFIHIWGNENEGTEGCTAMKEDDMVKLLHWINARNNPLLAQFPKAEYAKFAAQYNLPIPGGQ